MSRAKVHLKRDVVYNIKVTGTSLAAVIVGIDTTLDNAAPCSAEDRQIQEELACTRACIRKQVIAQNAG